MKLRNIEEMAIPPEEGEEILNELWQDNRMKH